MTTTIAFLGPRGTFTEHAVWQFVTDEPSAVPQIRRDDVELLAVDSQEASIAAVREGRAHYACVAIENSVDGAVTPTLDALADTTSCIQKQSVQIYYETDCSITFAISRSRSTQRKSTRIRFATHPVAWRQVRHWVQHTLPDAVFLPASSNAEAADMVLRGEADYAASPLSAATLRGLDIVARDIADDSTARTRFVLVGPAGRPTPPTGIDRTSLVFSVRHAPGSLVGALNEFARRTIDITRIESRPSRTHFGLYRFYVDVLGHISDPTLGEALMALRRYCEDIAYLGSWPVGSRAREDLNAFSLSDAPSENSSLSDEAWLNSLREGTDIKGK